MKIIKFSLDSRSIGAAIKEMEAYRKEFDTKLLVFIEALAERGVEIVKQNIVSLDAIETGELLSSVKTIMYAQDKKGIVFTDCPWAAFVEFGTGVKGSESSHPTLPWGYDTNDHGQDGWYYYDKKQGRVRFTKGMPSRPFMYNTVLELANEAANVAKGVFG